MNGQGEREQPRSRSTPRLFLEGDVQDDAVVSVVGRDRYRAGEGSIEMRVLSLMPVAKTSRGGLNQGVLWRFLGEGGSGSRSRH